VRDTSSDRWQVERLNLQKYNSTYFSWYRKNRMVATRREGCVFLLQKNRYFVGSDQLQAEHLFTIENTEKHLSGTLWTSMESMGSTKGIHPVQRNRRGGMAKMEEYAPGGSGMSEAACVIVNPRIYPPTE
jgi:hypothetical protein